MSRLRLLWVRPARSSSASKFRAAFRLPSGERKVVQFGAKGYSDFTKNKDIKRKQLYLKRHAKNENWQDPLTPGALSRWILWNKPSLQQSIQDFKRRFRL